MAKLKPRRFFSKPQESYTFSMVEFTNKTLSANITKNFLDNFTKLNVQISLERVEHYGHKAHVQQTILAVINHCMSGLLLASIWFNALKFQQLDFYFSSIILFSMNILLSFVVMINRFLFLSPRLFYSVILLFLVQITFYVSYFRCIKKKVSQFVPVVQPVRIFTSLAWIVIIITSYFTNDSIEGLFLFMMMLPVFFKISDTHVKVKLKFNPFFMLGYQFLQIASSLWLMNMGQEQSLLPKRKWLSWIGFLACFTLYSMGWSQLLWHPKLFSKVSYGHEVGMYRPTRVKVSQLEGYRSGDSEGTGEQRKRCAICLVEFDDPHEMVLRTKCNHLYHEACLEQWLKIKQECPTCKARCTSMNGDGGTGPARPAERMVRGPGVEVGELGVTGEEEEANEPHQGGMDSLPSVDFLSMDEVEGGGGNNILSFSRNHINDHESSRLSGARRGAETEEGLSKAEEGRIPPFSETGSEFGED